ncbi:MAG: YbhB/YbcL family Raf kinase inhibitor-like protein [Candidatus Competibacteraceae bacterium]
MLIGVFLSSPVWAAITVTSSAFTNGGVIPLANVFSLGTQCQGSNLSPPLQWTAGPAGTATFTVEMVDLTASNFLHWRISNIPAATTTLPQGVAPATPPFIQAVNGFGTAGYGGPCPPNDGLAHQYQITVSALDAANAVLDTGKLIGLRQFGQSSTVSVPNVVDLTQSAATTAIQNAGLTPGTVTQEASTTVAAGNVIRQSPAASTTVAAGSAVNLVVSSGFPQAQQGAVPDVTNKSVADAREILFAVGLFQVGAITVQPSATIPAGLVSGQSPAAGTVTTYGTTVNLVVSSGSQPPVTTPNVVGLPVWEW